MDLGTFTWGGHAGTQYLAPEFPEGGIDGGHLVFAWNEGDVEAAVSLHAWRPLEQAVATLKAVVSSIVP